MGTLFCFSLWVSKTTSSALYTTNAPLRSCRMLCFVVLLLYSSSWEITKGLLLFWNSFSRCDRWDERPLLSSWASLNSISSSWVLNYKSSSLLLEAWLIGFYVSFKISYVPMFFGTCYKNSAAKNIIGKRRV